MGISILDTTREDVAMPKSTSKPQQELDIDRVLEQLTLDEKISLTAGE